MSQDQTPPVMTRVRITGRVQKVGYRMWTDSQARTLGLSGWVRNRADGSVEALFYGPAQAVESMVDACRKGPMRSGVEAVERLAPSPEDQASPPDGFTILPTA